MLAQSMKKTDEIAEFIYDNKLDILAITESWLTGTNKDKQKCSELTPPWI